MKRLIVYCLVFLLAGCAQPLSKKEVELPIDAPPSQRATPPTFVEVKNKDDHELLKRAVRRTNLPATTLLQAVYAPVPYYVTVEAADDQVDLSQRVSVRADKYLSVKDYLAYLSGLTGYHFELQPETRTIRVSSQVTRAWNLATLASAGETQISVGGGSGENNDSDDSGTDETGTEIAKSFSRADPWGRVVSQANCIMETAACGSSGDEGAGAGRAADGSWVAANRLTGQIRASGPAQKIAQLDRWLTPLQESAGRFIRLDVAVFEVVLDDSRGRSVDLRALNDGISRTVDLANRINNEDNRRARYTGNIIGDALDNAGSFVFGATAEIGDLAFDLVLRYLKTEGEVTLLNRANLITPNGETATVRSLERFYFVDDQEIIPGDANNQQRISTSLERESVGLEIAVTPQYLDDRRLAISIVPALSALSRYDNIESGGVLISEAPRTTLTTLSSRGVTESGRPIALGGLASENFQIRLTDAGLSSVPIVGSLLDSGSQIHQRRQLIVLVVPHEVDV